MKKLFLYVFLVFFVINIKSAFSDSSDWYIVEDESQRIESYNIKTAKEFGPRQFKIHYIRSSTKEKIKYKKIVQRKLFDYCGREDGTYPSPIEILIYGQPELKDFGIKVEKNGNTISYQTPYTKFLNYWEYDQEDFRGRIWISCYLNYSGFQIMVKKEEDPSEIPTLMSRKETIKYFDELAYAEYHRIHYYDCLREMDWVDLRWEFLDKKEGDMEKVMNEYTDPNKIKWFIPEEGTRGLQEIKDICSKLE